MNIWQNKIFARFFISFTVGNIGDWFDIFAMQIIFVHEFHASSVLMGILILFYFLPSILLGPFAGVWADRLSQRDLMLITDVVAALITLGIFFSHSIAIALILLIIRSCLVSFNTPAQQAYIKHVVPDEQLIKAASYTNVVFQMCKVMGPLLGAAMLVFTSARTCLAINSFSFLLSAIILFGLPKGNPEIGGETPEHWLRATAAGGKFIWEHKFMRLLIAVATVWMFCSMLRQAQLAIILKHLLPNTPKALGIFMGFDGIGAVVTSYLMSRKKKIVHPGLYLCLGFFLLSIGIAGVGIYQFIWPHYLLYLSAIIIGLGTGIQIVTYGYLIKKETPKDKIGRVSGTSSAILNAALALGTLVSGFFVMQYGVREVYLTIALIMVILAIFSAIFIKRSYKGI